MKKSSLKNGLKLLFQKSTLLICAELIFAPSFVYGQGGDVGRKESNWQKFATALQYAGTAVNAGIGAYLQGSQQPQDQYNNYFARFQQELRLTPVDPRQVPPVFGNCLVLPARANSIPLCTEQNPQAIQTGYAAAAIDVARTNLSDLQNFQIAGNERLTTQGVGCYNKGMEDFNGILLAREEQLNVYKENLKQMLDQFKLASKQDLETIKESTALLDGKDSERESGKYLKDYKFEKDFLAPNDPNNICGSVLDEAIFKRNGENNGLRGIEDALFSRMTERNERDGGMSAKELLTNTKQLTKEISDLTSKLSSHMNNRNASSINLSEVPFTGTLISKSNGALQNAISNFNADLNNQFEALQTKSRLDSTIEGSGLDSLKSQIDSNSIDQTELASALSDFERDTKNSCLSQSIKDAGFADASNFASKFRNPNISKQLGREADNSLANSIVTILSSDDTIDNKLKEIEALQNKSSNSKYIMTTGKTVKIGERTIYASTALRPANLVGIFVQTCNQNFKASNNSKGYSQYQAMKALQNYANQREKIKKTAGLNVANKLKKELVSCPDNNSTGVAINSCSSALNVNSPGFCVRTAKKCASNMNGCYKKAQAKVKEVAKIQDDAKTRYNTEVGQLKQQMKAEMLAMSNFLQAQARSIDAQVNLGTVFELPSVNFDLSEDLFQGAAQGIDPDLALEDPDAYFKKMTDDIDSMRQGLQQQRLALVGGNGQGGKLGELKNQYVASYQSAEQQMQGLIENCQQALNGVAENLQKAREAQNENNAKMAETCGELQAFQANPEDGNAEELANDLGKVVQLAAATPLGQSASQIDQANISAIRAFNSSCGKSSDDNPGILFGSSKQDGKISIYTACEGDYQKLEDMYGPEVMVQVCSGRRGVASGSQSCSDNKFLEEVGDKKLCLEKETLKVIEFASTSQCEPSDSKEYILDTDEKRLERARDIVKYGKASCVPESKVSRSVASNEDALKQIVSAYNCNKDRQRAGQLGVSVCNANMANAGVGGKNNAIGGAANNIGSALGALQALRQ